MTESVVVDADVDADAGSDMPPTHGGLSKLILVVGVALAVAVAGAIGYAAGSASRQNEVATAQAAADDAREQARTDAEKQIEAGREQYIAEYESRVAEVANREVAVQHREDKVGAVEAQIAANSIRPGTYLVPEEVGPGRYRSTGTAGLCYAEQTKGDDIIWNAIEEANTRPVFTVQNVPGSEVKFDSACGTIEKIG